MDPISNIDRVVLLLRQRLQERAKLGSSKAARNEQDPGASGLDNVQALAAVDGVDDGQLGRALIQGILVEQFGSDVINDAKFQQVVDRVTETLASDEDGSQLMARVVGELRKS